MIVDQVTLSPEILQRLDALAAKLGVTSQYIFGVLVRQAKFEAIENIMAALASSAVSAVCFIVVYRIVKYVRSPKYSHDEEWPFFCSFFSSLVGAVTFGIAASFLISIVSLLGNPEYWALERILTALGGK